MENYKNIHETEESSENSEVSNLAIRGLAKSIEVKQSDDSESLKSGSPTMNLYAAIFDRLPTLDVAQDDLYELISVLSTISMREFDIITRHFGIGRIEEFPIGRETSEEGFVNGTYQESRERLIPLHGYSYRRWEEPEMKRFLRLDNTRETYTEIAKENSITPAAIQEISQSAIKKLRHPSRAEKIKLLFNSPAELRKQIQENEDKNTSLRLEIASLNRQLEQERRNNAFLRNRKEQQSDTQSQIGDIDKNNIQVDLYGSIDQLDLSNRTRNALNRYYRYNGNIKTIEDLINKTKEDLYHIRMFGDRAYEEIILALEKVGLSLSKDNLQ